MNLCFDYTRLDEAYKQHKCAQFQAGALHQPARSLSRSRLKSLLHQSEWDPCNMKAHLYPWQLE